jgi:thiol-disulfide isomerase/thioredoxin
MKLFIKYFIAIMFLVVCFGFKESNQSKYKLIVFEGSDWCANCRRLEKNVLSDTLFLKQLEKMSVIIERIDFPQRKKLDKTIQEYNNTIADRYAFDGGFPTIIFTGNEITGFQKISYTNQSAEEILTQIKSKIEVLK